MAESDVLLKAGEEIEFTPEQMKEFIKCRNDIVYFAQNYFHIVVLGKGKRKIKLYPFQEDILKTSTDLPNGKRHMVLLASRQIGKTTMMSIILLHEAIFNEDRTIAVLANKEKTALEIIKRIKTAYQMLPRFLQMGVTPDGWNKKSIVFQNGSSIHGSATSSSAIRGLTIDTLLLDEYAFVPTQICEDFMSSVYPTIISGDKSRILMVSTPQGLNHFYQVYNDAERGINNYHPIKVYWSQVPGRDEKWKNKIIKDIGMRRWRIEFELEFVGSSNTLIEGSCIMELEKNTIEPVEFKYGTTLAIYEPPVRGCTYAIGADPAKGIGKDNAVAQIFKINMLENFEQVAVFCDNRTDPKKFARIIVELSEFYNSAPVLIENNGKEGALVCDSLFYDHDFDRMVNTQISGRREFGIMSNSKTKLDASLNMKRYLENGWVKIKDKKTVFELSRYEEVKPNVFKCGDSTGHDDRCTSLSWVLYLVELQEYMELGWAEDGKPIQDQNNYGRGDGSEHTPVFDNGLEGSYIDSDGQEWEQDAGFSKEAMGWR